MHSFTKKAFLSLFKFPRMQDEDSFQQKKSPKWSVWGVRTKEISWPISTYFHHHIPKKKSHVTIRFVARNLTCPTFARSVHAGRQLRKIMSAKKKTGGFRKKKSDFFLILRNYCGGASRSQIWIIYRRPGKSEAIECIRWSERLFLTVFEPHQVIQMHA